MGAIIQKSQSTHYYTQEGQPAYNSGLAEARKKGYRPSTTTILGIIDKFNIGVWKQEQAILAVFDALDAKWKEIVKTSSDIKAETQEYWNNSLRPDNKTLMDKIKEFLQERTSRAAVLGTKIHKMAENHLEKIEVIVEKDSIEEAIWDNARGWIDKHIGTGCSERSFANNILGYGGRIDFEGTLKNMGDYFYQDEFEAVVDFKTQNVKEGKPNYWEDMAYQLASYRKADSEKEEFIPIENGKRCVTVIISTAPDFRGVTAKVWPETEDEKKELKIRAGITIEKGWEVFKAAKELFYKVKGL